MIGPSRSLRAYACTHPVDMRKGYDGLFSIVRDGLGLDALSGDMYLFVSKDMKRAKVLLWDGTGLCVYAKRLERGRFACLWEKGDGRRIGLTAAELHLFLDGSRMVGKVPLSPPRFEVPAGRIAAG